MRRLGATLIGVFVAALLSRAQQPSPAPQTFRTAVDLVDVDVSVLDRHRQPVRGLTAADFTVLEDGRARPIVAFSEVELPPRELPPAKWMADIAPDVQSNQLPPAGRLIVILMDRALSFEHIPAAQAFADATIDQLRPGDLAAVVYATRGVPQNFTADRERLRAAIHQPFVGLPEDDDGGEAQCYCGRCSLDTIESIAKALQEVRQRRKLLFVVGTNITILPTGACSGQVDHVRREALRALQAANVTVHSFDPSGLQTLAAGASARTAAARPGMASLLRRANVGFLPGETGGRVMADPVRPQDAVTEVFRESNAYYVLGFEPAAPPDRRFHDIRVRVNRRDVTLQARRGYYAGGVEPRNPLPALLQTPVELRAAVAGMWPRVDVPLSIAAAPLSGPDLRTGVVAVTVGVRPPADWPIPSPSRGAAEVVIGAFDRNGRALGVTRQSLVPDATALEYEAHAQLPLKPGRYEIRAALEDSRLGRAGSVYTYVEIPNYQQTDVALSGVMLQVEPGKPAFPAEGFGSLVPVVPTVRREFRTTDRVTGFVRIYQGLTRAAMPGYLLAEVQNDRDQVVFRQELRTVPAQFGAGRAADVTVDLPIARLAPGAYLFTVEARHGVVRERRDVRFAVVR